MNILLIFFALPIAVIIISIALQKILKCPALVAAIVFSIFLIVTFIVDNLNFLIAAIVYAIISFVTAFITCIVCRFLNRLERENSCSCRRGDSCEVRGRDNTGGCRRREITCYCNSDNDNSNLLTISSSPNDTFNSSGNQNDTGCSYQISNSNGLSARINIIPNSNNNNNNNVSGNNNGCSCCRRR